MRRRFSPFVVIVFLIAAFCLSSARAWAQPAVESRRGLELNGWMVAVAVARALDATSTCAAYHMDNVIVRDANPLVRSCGSIIATESASTAATWWADRRLRSGGHGRMATVLMATTVALEAVFVAHNVVELRRLQRR
jgi:hypothetical protein